jgi:hypothetical protein
MSIPVIVGSRTRLISEGEWCGLALPGNDEGSGNEASTRQPTRAWLKQNMLSNLRSNLP